MSPTRVVIAGCGIAGPILAIFLKTRGYDPVIYERTDSNPSTGISMALQSNGLRVLDLIPGLFDKLPGHQLDCFKHLSILPEDEGLLMVAQTYKGAPEALGYSPRGVNRGEFHRTIVQAAVDHGVPIHYGHRLVSIEQEEKSVKVGFADGTFAEGSFVIGCDGLHSNTRSCLIGDVPADFTGLTQTGGISTILPSMVRDCAVNVYADGAHLIAYQITDTSASWAITQHEDEAKETWRAMGQEQQDVFRASRFTEWPYGVGEMIKSTPQITKYGLYDRPALKKWHDRRVVLVGDAAHPTSPHLGQGANQAFEDIYHLVRCLLKYNPTGESPSTEVLAQVFGEYESIRVERATALVQGARKQGEIRVVSGVDACKARNQQLRDLSTEAGQEKLRQGYSYTISGPFTGDPEI